MKMHLMMALFFTCCVSACSTLRSADLSIWGDPPKHLKGNITTKVEWLSTPQVAVRCAELLASFGHVPVPAHGCTYQMSQGEIVLVLPYNIHPLVVHELAHAHQFRLGERVSHQNWKRMQLPN